MRFVADLHIHSRFSRATSRALTLPELHLSAQRKGIAVLGTGDVTHPGWIEELADQLEPAEEGLFRLRPELARQADAEAPGACRSPVRFLLQGEISSIYKHDGVVRKVHNLVYCPDFPAARRFLGTLDRLGNIRSDGRPILGLSSRDVLEVLLEADPRCRLVPAHVWTPWFSLLGSKSGYGSVEECFGDLAGEIFALETGLSSDPAMNWRVSGLDRYALLSNSDAHSSVNLGREANDFDLEPSFEGIFASLRPGHPQFLGTVEFFPEEGKYHLDGHRRCGRRLTPRETRAVGGRCPVCGGPVTVGVLHRVEELADRGEGVRPSSARPFARLVPLAEVVAECVAAGARSRRVAQVVSRLASHLGPELFVLREAPLDDVGLLAGPVVAEALRRVRQGRLRIEPGYDGEFGTIRIFTPAERAELGRQKALFALPEEASALSGEAAGGDALAEAPVSAPPPCEDPKTFPLESQEGDRLLAGLNPEQHRAVDAPPRPLLIVAGPGTGKTRTLTHRIARKLLRGGTSPERVLAVTFTHRAAGEMRERLAGLLGDEGAARVRIATLHALGLEILRAEAGPAGFSEGFRVLGEPERTALLRDAGASAREARTACTAISLAKRGGSPPAEDLRWDAAYESALEALGAVDLDDLVLRSVRLLEADGDVRGRWQGRYDHLAVDEFQDLDPAQYRLVSLLAPGAADLTAIGDPDQSIYGFRGADPNLFVRFAEDRPGAATVALARNYRSTPSIVAASRQLLGRDGTPDCGGIPGAKGPRIRLVDVDTDEEEARFVAREVERLVGGTTHRSVGGGPRDPGGPLAFGDVAVLHRLRSQRPLLEAALGRAGLPFSTAGEEPALLRGKGKRLLRGLRRRAPAEGATEAVRALLDSLGIDPAGLLGGAWLAAAAAAASVGALLEAVALRTAEDDFDPRAERVALLTLHASKGLEFSAVFVTGCEEGVIPYFRDGEDEGEGRLSEERRLLYVGMTRARSHLYLIRARRRRLHGRARTQQPSRFLAGLEKALVEETSLGPPAGAPDRGKRQLRLL